MIFDQMMLIGGSAATKIDLRATFQIMESFFGNKFDETCREIRYVLTDSCTAVSKSQLQSLAAKLDTIALLESPRKTPRKCLAHIAGLFTKKLAANFSKTSGLANMHKIMPYGKHDVIEDFSILQENDSSFMVKMH